MHTELQKISATDTQEECAAWFAQALRGDSDAATRLYECCVPMVRNWLCKSVPSVMAEEFAHEAIVRAFRCAEQFRPGTSFVCWVRTLAWRMALNALRDDSRRHSRETAFFEQKDLCGHLRDEGVFEALERCVAELPGEQRQLIRMRFQLDQSAGEIAASLGRSRVAVAVSLNRICKRLRSGLEQHPHLSINKHKHTQP